MANQLHFSSVVGFTYQGDNYHPHCTGEIIRVALKKYPHFPNPPKVDVHWLVGQYARATGHAIYATDEFNVYDNREFDSNDVPKPFDRWDLDEDEVCGFCGGEWDFA